MYIPIQSRRLPHLPLVCILALLLLLSAGSQNSVKSAAPQGAAPTAMPTATPAAGEYVSSDRIEAMYLSLTGVSSGSVSGQLQLAEIFYDQNSGSYSLYANHDSVTGTVQNGQIQLNTQRWGTITGTYTDQRIILAIPLKSGGVGSFTFTPGSNDQFNTDVAHLQSSIDTANANATASANATATTYGQQQAVNKANSAVAHDLSAIQSDTSNLNQQATFDSVFSEYAQTWQQMQNDYQTEVNDSKNGCGDGNYNYGTVQYDAGSVKYDEGSIQYDDGSFDYQKNSIDGYYTGIQQDIITLKSDWQSLQQAVANNASGTPESNYQQSDIDSAAASGNNALNNADSVVKKAKQTREAYDDEANNLDNKAQALPGKMGC